MNDPKQYRYITDLSDKKALDAADRSLAAL